MFCWRFYISVDFTYACDVIAEDVEPVVSDEKQEPELEDATSSNEEGSHSNSQFHQNNPPQSENSLVENQASEY